MTKFNRLPIIYKSLLRLKRIWILGNNCRIHTNKKNIGKNNNIKYENTLTGQLSNLKIIQTKKIVGSGDLQKPKEIIMRFCSYFLVKATIFQIYSTIKFPYKQIYMEILFTLKTINQI